MPGDLRTAADPGRVDQQRLAAVDLDPGVDRVAGGPGDVADDRPLGAEQRVEQRGLADVRTAEDRDPWKLVGFGRAGALAGQRGDPVEQVPGAEAVGGRHRDGLAEPEPVELGGEMDVGGVVHLVGDDDHRLRGSTEQCRHLGVAGPQPRLGIDDMEDRVGVGDRLTGLMLDGPRQRVLGRQVDAAGIDQYQRDPVPLGLDLLAVAGHPRLGVRDGLAAAGEPVDQRALARVRVADDRDLHRRTPLTGGPARARGRRSAR